MSLRATEVRAGGERRSRARSLALVGGTVLVLAAGFGVYLWSQPEMPAVTHEREETLTPAARPPGDGGSGPINSGKGVWVKSYDKEGRLASQFRTVRYDPKSDNTIHVTRPEAQFFLAHDQLLRITGREGVVVTQDEPGGGGSFGKAPAKMPTKGRLEDVKLELFDASQAARLMHEEPARPMLTVAMNNAVFDSDTFRIYTDDYTEGGKTVAAADVPVTVSGDDYDFKGWGLLIRWNERNSQLELLEVARGDHLTIKHPGALGPAGGGLLSMRSGRIDGPLPGMLASADAGAAGQIVGGGAVTRRPATHSAARAQPTYRADFDRAVRIWQAGRELATADAMQVDFLAKSESKKTATAPASAPAPSSASTAPATIAAPRAQSPAATRPVSDGPITIRWTGKLRVTPIEPKAGERVPAGQAAVRLFGAPVVLKQAGSTLQAAVALFRTADSSLLLTGSAHTPVLMRDSTGATVSTESMLFRQQARVAELTGKGEAKGLVRSDETQDPRAADGQKADGQKAAGRLDARWDKKATIHFAGTTQGDMTIGEALLEGAVSVNHPQLHLQADSLDLLFGDEPGAAQVLVPAVAAQADHAAQGDLRHVFARGNVRAELTDAQQERRHITSDRLAVTMATGADGAIYPALFGAEGHVHSVDDKQGQELRCQWLQVAMAPRRGEPQRNGQSGAVDLDTLLAGGDVRVSNGDSHAQGMRLAVDTVEGQPQVTLSGAPATISDRQSRLSGPVVTYAPHAKHASVRGPGTLHAVQQAAPGAAARPMEARWTDGIEVDGNKGRIDLTGQVVTTSVDADGARQTATGDRLTLLMAPARPTTRPAIPTQHADATRPAPADPLFSGEDNFLANQTVQAAWFEGDARLQSVWNGPGGEVLRRLYLSAPSVRYSIAEQRLLVPAAGKMLVEDHRKPEASDKPATGDAPAARGTTAFQWNKQLTFDQMRHEATMVGKVVIVHEPQAGTTERGFEMHAQQVTAELAPAEAQASAATAPATRPAEIRVQLKRLTAEGQVHVQSGVNQIDAQSITFNPATGLLTARGTEAAPVQLSGATAGSRGSFVTLTYDLKNDRVVSMTGAQFRGNP